MYHATINNISIFTKTRKRFNNTIDTLFLILYFNFKHSNLLNWETNCMRNTAKEKGKCAKTEKVTFSFVKTKFHCNYGNNAITNMERFFFFFLSSL